MITHRTNLSRHLPTGVVTSTMLAVLQGVSVGGGGGLSKGFRQEDVCSVTVELWEVNLLVKVTGQWSLMGGHFPI